MLWKGLNLKCLFLLTEASWNTDVVMLETCISTDIVAPTQAPYCFSYWAAHFHLVAAANLTFLPLKYIHCSSAHMMLLRKTGILVSLSGKCSFSFQESLQSTPSYSWMNRLASAIFNQLRPFREFVCLFLNV